MFVVRVGEIIVFKLEGKDIPIVHRVVRIHEKSSGEMDILTKGDNNAADDRALYPRGQSWLNYRHILGRTQMYATCARL